MTKTVRLRLGTRASALARWQADWVAARLAQVGVEVELVLITTGGDVTSGPIGNIGSQGLFTKEIQRSLLDDKIDLAVHSLKDLPTQRIDGLTLAAVPAREKAGDALVSNVADSVNALPRGASVGTGSMRRRTQLLNFRSDLNIIDIRGNLDTRLRKLDEGQYDAIILAEAGLIRLGLRQRIRQVIPHAVMLPAVGQGALGIEARDGDEATLSIVRQLDDRDTHAAIAAERSMLATLRGGCLAPVGAWGRTKDDRLHLDGVVLSSDGSKRIESHGTGMPDDAKSIGRRVAEDLLNLGAGDMINALRQRE